MSWPNKLRNGGTPQGFLVLLFASRWHVIRHLIRVILGTACIFFESDTFVRNSKQLFLWLGYNITQYIKMNKLVLWTLTSTIDYFLTFRVRDKKKKSSRVCFLSQLHKHTYYLKRTGKARVLQEYFCLTLANSYNFRNKMTNQTLGDGETWSLTAIIFRFSIWFFIFKIFFFW